MNYKNIVLNKRLIKVKNFIILKIAYNNHKQIV